jgi:hypothetical protein
MKGLYSKDSNEFSLHRLAEEYRIHQSVGSIPERPGLYYL